MRRDEQPERLTYCVEEAATVLGISRAFAYEAVQREDIPHLRIGRRILIPRSALQRLVDSPSLTSAEPREGGVSP